MAADVFISTAGAMFGDGRQRAEEQKLKNDKKKYEQSTGSRTVPHGICMKDRSKTGNQLFCLIVCLSAFVV